MSGFTYNFSHVVLDAIEGFDRAKTALELQGRITAVIAPFGFEYFCYAGPTNGPGSRFENSAFLNVWPKAWFDQYRSSNFWPRDPITKFTRKQKRSFLWSEAPVDDPVGSSIIEIAAVDHRMRHGLCIPIHGLAGYQASISFAGLEIDDKIEARAAVEIIGVYAANRSNQLSQNFPPPPKVLTPREREVMAWVAAGKTAWDIGSILRISVDTVNKLVASAMRRLNACNRPQAVAESIRRGEIAP